MNLSIFFTTLEIACVFACFILLLVMKNKILAVGIPTAVIGLLCTVSSIFCYLDASNPLANPNNSAWLLSSNPKQTADFAKFSLWLGIILLVISIVLFIISYVKSEKKRPTNENSFKNSYRARTGL